MSEIIGNRYQVTKLIGKGGMAEVYLAWDAILNREVAIKVLKSDMSDDDIALERFNREAGATTKLSHPNIVDVYDVGDDGDKHYIVMEYVKGYTLKQLIKKRGAIPYKEAVWMMKQLAGALMEAHRKGIIHRDVKSQNVLIKPDGTIKLSDFGIALANGSMQITLKDSVLGSVHYLAPELTKGKQASMQSDIYSLGIVFYELLTGKVPYTAETPVQVALMHVKGSIPSVRKFNSSIPQSVENIITLATAKSLNNRYKNIALMLQDLNSCLKPEHLNDKPIDLELLKENGFKQTIGVADNGDTTTTTIIKKKGFKVFFIALASLLAIGILFGILLLSGVISIKPKNVLVPDITNYTVLEARDILADNKLDLDESRIEYELSDHIEKDKIISINPTVGSEVEINTKVKITVSSGIYSVLGNYVGKDYATVKIELEKLNFNVKPEYIPDSNYEDGKIISQSLEPGYKYDPSINNQITLKCASNEGIMIDPSLKGESIEKAIEFFSANDIIYEEAVIYKDELSQDEEISKEYIESLNVGDVIKTKPELGTPYTQKDNNKVTVYYYGGE